jgi:hypothetical protein
LHLMASSPGTGAPPTSFYWSTAMFSSKVFKIAKPAKRHDDANDTTVSLTSGR